MFRSLFCALGACVLSCTAASAGPLVADAAEEAVIVPLADDPFEGFYGGLEFGHASGQKIYTPPGTVNPFTEGDVVGLFGGYSFQFGRIVAGGEVRMLDIDGLGTASSQIDGLTEVRARLGVALGDVFAYGAIGWTTALLADRPPFGLTDLEGLNTGFGVEVHVTERIFLGADYTRRELEGVTGARSVDVELDTMTLRAGLRF